MPAPFSSPFVTIGGRRTCPCSSMVCCRHPTLRQFFPLLSPTAYFFPTASFLPPAGNFLPIAAERFTVVSAGFQPRCGVKTGTLPRNRLVASATGGASAVSKERQQKPMVSALPFCVQELHPKSRRSRELTAFYSRCRCIVRVKEIAVLPWGIRMFRR